MPPVERMRRLLNSSLDIPLSFDPSKHSAGVDVVATNLNGFSQRHAVAAVDHVMIVTFVVVLLLLGRPYAVGRLIIAIVVLALQGVLFARA